MMKWATVMNTVEWAVLKILFFYYNFYTKSLADKPDHPRQQQKVSGHLVRQEETGNGGLQPGGGAAKVEVWELWPQQKAMKKAITNDMLNLFCKYIFWSACLYDFGCFLREADQGISWSGRRNKTENTCADTVLSHLNPHKAESSP